MWDDFATFGTQLMAPMGREPRFNGTNELLGSGVKAKIFRNLLLIDLIRIHQRSSGAF